MKRLMAFPGESVALDFSHGFCQ